MNPRFQSAKRTYNSIKWKFIRPSFRLAKTDTPLLFKKHVFICGIHRSGTTMLENIIRDVFDVSVLRANVPENEGQHMQNIYPPDNKYGGPGRFAFSPYMHPSALSDFEGEETQYRIMSYWTPHVVGHSDVLLEKSPPNLTMIPWLRSVFPNSYFIILSRDPRVVTMSTQKWVKISTPELLFHWHTAYDSAYRSMNSNCIHIKYQDLCENLERELRRIGTWIGLSRRASSNANARYSEIRSTDGNYLKSFSDIQLGHGAWDLFGYNISSRNVRQI